MATAALAERSWSVVVPHHARGARLARRRLADELAGEIAAPLLADAVAVLAELVGNAICHAEPLPGGVVRVGWQLWTSDGSPVVAVRVTDGGAANRTPALRTVGPEAVDGRGLRIVRALARRWGVDRDGLGQTVWAELTPSPHGGMA